MNVKQSIIHLLKLCFEILRSLSEEGYGNTILTFVIFAPAFLRLDLGYSGKCLTFEIIVYVRL